ncbi:uncharacterized protein V1518DRAFT_405632 [Limtongia smithiae]|uniref:uncharacterized protein n=1 Tax=Limtongia smithiae TaxID=1125753 RepID=UPI0034CDC779
MSCRIILVQVVALLLSTVGCPVDIRDHVVNIYSFSPAYSMNLSSMSHIIKSQLTVNLFASALATVTTSVTGLVGAEAYSPDICYHFRKPGHSCRTCHAKLPPGSTESGKGVSGCHQLLIHLHLPLFRLEFMLMRTLQTFALAFT